MVWFGVVWIGWQQGHVGMHAQRRTCLTVSKVQTSACRMPTSRGRGRTEARRGPGYSPACVGGAGAGVCDLDDHTFARAHARLAAANLGAIPVMELRRPARHLIALPADHERAAAAAATVHESECAQVRARVR